MRLSNHTWRETMHDESAHQLSRYYCNTMRSNSFPFVLGPLGRSLCLCGHETHTKDWGRDFPRDPKWRREGRSKRRQRDQLTTVGRGGQSAWDSCPENVTVSRRRQKKMEAWHRRESTEGRKATAKTCWPTEAGLTNARRCQHC